MKTKLLFLFSLSLVIQSCTFIEENIGVDLRIGKDSWAPIEPTENMRSPDSNPDLTDIALEKQKRVGVNDDPYDGYQVNAPSNGASIRQIDASMNRAADDVLLTGVGSSAVPPTAIVQNPVKTNEKPKAKKKKAKKQSVKPKAQPTACVPVQDTPVQPVQAPVSKPQVVAPAPVDKLETKEVKPEAPTAPVLAAPQIVVPTAAPVASDPVKTAATPAPVTPVAPKVEAAATSVVPAVPAAPVAPKVEVPVVSTTPVTPLVTKFEAPAAPVAPKVDMPAAPTAPKVPKVDVPVVPASPEVPAPQKASAEEVIMDPFPPFNPAPLADDKTTLEEQALSMPPVPNLKIDDQNAELNEFKKSLKDKYKDEKKGNLDGVQEAELPPLELNQ